MLRILIGQVFIFIIVNPKLSPNAKIMSIECINNCSIEEEQSESILSFSANTVTRTKGTVKSLTTSKVFNYVSANKGELYTNLKQTQENTNTYLYTYD